MLNSLLIRNFQSHKKTLLNFVPGVNVIVGTSSHGKTAILRAIYLLAFNRPGGLRFLNRYVSASSVKVKAKMMEGVTISLTRGKTNIYKCGKNVFKAFGRNVPEEITKVMNLSDVNIQAQLDSPFLVTGSAGEFAKIVNKITKLDKCDVYVASLTSDINATKRLVNSIDDEIEEMEDSLAKLEGLEKLQKLFTEIEELENKIEDLESDQETIFTLGVKVKKAGNAVKKDTGQLEVIETDIEKVNKLDEQIKNAIDEKNAIDLFQCARVFLKETEKELENAVGIFIKALEDEGSCPLCFSELTGNNLKNLIYKIQNNNC